MKPKVIHGDVREKIKLIQAESIQTCVTSPPYYGLRDYQTSGQLGLEQTPEEYVEQMVGVFRGVHKALKKDGTLWLNMGDTYCGTGHKNSLVDPKHPKGRNAQSTAINNKIDGIKSKDLIGIPWLLAFALRKDGWFLRQDIIWHKPNPLPEPVKDRCTKSHEYLFLLSKNNHYYYDNESIKEPAKDWGTRDRTKGKYHNKGTGLQPHTGLTKSYPKKNKRSVWSITSKPYEGAHFATFPPELVEPCIKAGSRKGDTVLDPFWGSGTTGSVALKLGRKAIGIELNASYIEMSMKRFEQPYLEI